LAYRTAWYEPLVPGTLAYALKLPASKKYCNGGEFADPANPPKMARIDGPVTLVNGVATYPVDWNGNGASGSTSQDINFDGNGAESLAGYIDRNNFRLNQLGG